MLLAATFVEAIISGSLIFGGNLINKLGPAHEAHWLCAAKNICGPDETYVLQGMKPVYTAGPVQVQAPVQPATQTPGDVAQNQEAPKI